MVKDQPSYSGTTWTWTEFGGRVYLMRIIGSQGVYVGALIDLENMVYPLAKSTLFDDYEMIYTTQEGIPLTYTGFVDEHGIDLDATGGDYYLSGRNNRYLVLSTDINRSDVRMVALIPDPTYLAGLNVVQIALFILSVLAILVIPFMIIDRKSVV